MAEDHWEDIDPAVPLLLLPVRIETRSDDDGAVLRVRIYPDDIHVDAFDEQLTHDEVRAGKRYWLARWPPLASGGPDPWAELIGAVGPRRAAWVATALTPTNLDDRPAAAPQFTPVETGEPDHRPRARLLPDCFRVVVVQGGASVSVTGESIDPNGLALGPRIDRTDNGEPIEDELGMAVNMLRAQPGATVDPELEWLVRYGAAEAAGMAVTVDLPEPGAPVDRLYVIGVRTADSPQEGSAAVSDLLRAHAFSDGLAFIPVGTATNNTPAARSAWSRVANAPGQPSTDPAPLAGYSDAGVLSAALGIDTAVLTGLDGATSTGQGAAAAFATALWPVTWGTFLDKALVPTASGGGLPVAAREEVRTHAINHVRGRGPLPSLRVGKQPYGVLPVSAHGAVWDSIEGGPVDTGLAALLARIRPLWRKGAAHVPTVTSGDIEHDLPLILGHQPVSRALRVRTALSSDEAGDVIVPGLDAVKNIAAQTVLSIALTKLIGADLGLWVTADALGEPTRNLALPLADDSDPAFCEALVAQRNPPDTLSVLQALLGLADARVRREVEEFLTERHLPRLLEWLQSASDVLGEDTVGLASEALRVLGEGAWDELDLYRGAAARVEDAVGFFDPARFSARFPMAALRPHPVDRIREVTEGARVVAGALRAAQQFAEMRAAIKRIGAVEDTAERALLLSENLDCASHRLDAWLTSLAARRLARARDGGVDGLVVGAFGWVENIDISPPAGGGPVYQAPGDGGYVLAPSPAHAATAAVLRGARLTHDPGDAGDAALDIDLSSTRVRAALSVIDGMRSGQPLSALLGYRLERWMHESTSHLNPFIYCLRSAAPLTAGKSTDRTPGAVPSTLESVAASEVVDGLRLLELNRSAPAQILARLNDPPTGYRRYFDSTAWSPPTPDQRSAINGLIERLDRLHDAVADVLLSESVHQLVSGSSARAAAAMDALAGDAISPDPEVVRTPRSGVALAHRLMALLPTAAGAGDSDWADGTRRSVHPGLERWARDALGDADRIVLATDAGNGATATLADARIGALDLVAAAAGGDDAQRFWAWLRRRVDTELPNQPLLRPGGLAGDLLTFGEAWALAGSLRRLLAHARAATAADLTRASDAAVASLAGDGNAQGVMPRPVDRAELRIRAGAAVDALRTTAELPGDTVDYADALALFGIGSSVDTAALPAEQLTAHVAALRTSATARALAAKASLDAYDSAPPSSDTTCLTALADVVQTVFEDRLPFSPRLVATGSPDEFVTALRAGVRVSAENRPVSDGRDVRPWLTRYSRVRPGAQRFAETLLLREALGPRRTLRVAQLSAADFGTWIGLSFPQDAGPPAHPVTGIVVDAPDLPHAADALSALVIDEWAEVVPHRTEIRDPATGEPTGDTRELHTAGLAVHANRPNARAPQCMLLAVTPDGQPWSPDKVVDVLADTMDMARERAVALEQVPLVGRLLPATYVQDWSLQGEPVLDLHLLLTESAVRAAVLGYVAEKD